MPSDLDPCASSSHEETGTVCGLETLVKRSQLDFEIDFFERILSRDPNYVEVLRRLGDLFAEKGCHRRALQVDLRLAQLQPKKPVVFYNLACSLALLKQEAQALDALRQALALGYSDLDKLLTDPDLSGLQSNQEFLKMLVELEVLGAATRTV